MISYQPSKAAKTKHIKDGDIIPVQFIPRKPHKNGLLIYHACTYVNHPTKSNKILPFIVDAMPHLSPLDTNPHDFLRWVMKRY